MNRSALRPLMPGLFMCLFMCLCPSVAVHAQLTGSETQVKAAFLAQFANYVQWPESVLNETTPAFVFGVLEAEDVAADLEAITMGRQIHDRPVQIRRLGPDDALNNLHVLFIGQASGNASAVLAQSTRQPLLTVTETETPIYGNVIHFVLDDDRVRFDIDLGRAQSQELSISARLLNVARRITR